MKDTKAKILGAASQLFLMGGTGALSVRAIAKQAGVSTIGIYSHFQGKQGILDALYIEGFHSVSRALKVDTLANSPREAVLTAARNYLNNAEQLEAHYSLIFGKLDGNYEPSADAKQAGIEAFEQLTELVGGLLPATASKSQKQDAAIRVWSLIHGFVSLRHHAVAQLVDMSDWKERTMKTAEMLVDDLIEAELT
ncbi:TetR/AcrR family transcriptional regulator [Marinobacter sp. CHS3-4]|uniref:TetR/AcrR family transcriptional regulator n=1 Tax=Marinobacter sp. CHS3-4 TaxID=3045174 RepID=UPI0024B5A87C|nr:TetR/AcrR family transcriptional regulator [Marinobacter sp. CHS3-4]MDI9243954.1 TetR family transcriptional regulator [Marinobacter sp. CHS3-4]